MQYAYARPVKITSARHLMRRSNLLWLIANLAEEEQWLANSVRTPKSHLSALKSGARGVGDDLAARFDAVGVERLTLAPGWFDRASLLAQSVSQPAVQNARQGGSRRVEWGAMTYDELPEEFEVVVPDDAMADRVRKGNIVTVRKQRTASAGQAVLVANRAGEWFLRSYVPLQGQRFAAAPRNKDYGPPLDSEADGLEILGVRLFHIDAGEV